MSLLAQLISGTRHVHGLAQLKEALACKRSLRVKLGIDPTRADLTFGHMVGLNKLRKFQDHGHHAILVIGDYTATIGDPSGVSSMRPEILQEEVQHNAKTYLDQAFQVIDPARTTVRYNSEWFSKMHFSDMLSLARKMTVARMLERDDFSKRYQSRKPISIIEFLYPLLQGYDSLYLKSDVEIGGTDQLFNLSVGRLLQKEAKQFEQVIITTPLLIGLDGIKKMSKSLDNYIAFNDAAKDMFGKIMSISDTAMWNYYELLLESTEKDLIYWKEKHPIDAKKNMAVALVSRFHSQQIAKEELLAFENLFSSKEDPETMPTFTWEALTMGNNCNLVDILFATKLFSSKRALSRLAAQGAIKINRKCCLSNPKNVFLSKNNYVIRVGKRNFVKVIE